jgi:hypothetical protein
VALLKSVKDVVYSITLKPNPKDDKQEAKIYFESSEQKHAYVTAEFNYCYDEYKAYSAAMTLDERAKQFVSLCSKRVAYARKVGYGPKGTNPRVWEKRPKNPVPPTTPTYA